MLKTRTWLLLFGAVLMAALAALLLQPKEETGTALIYSNGVCIHTIDLANVSEPCTISVVGENGTNIVSVERGRICVSMADCPDQICVQQGWRSGGLSPIVCLPNKLMIRFEPTLDETGVDGVVQ